MQEKERLAQLSKQSASSQKRPPASSSTYPPKVESSEASPAANAASGSSTSVIESEIKAAVTLVSETSQAASAEAVSSSGIALSSASTLSTAAVSEHTEDPNLTSVAASSQLLPKNVSVPVRALEQNLNRERGLGGTGEAGVLDAHSVDEALAALSVAQRGSAAALADAARDRRTVHKRARVAFRQFEVRPLRLFHNLYIILVFSCIHLFFKWSSTYLDFYIYYYRLFVY